MAIKTFTEKLREAQSRNRSMLCVGLDPDPARFPGKYKNDPDYIYTFCSRVVNATKDAACVFKPQIAYFAAHRAEGPLEKLIEHIHREAPHVPVILDSKRGDIGSTAEQYAKEAFARYKADAVTLSPYLGFDSIEPYLRYADRGIFLLTRTSNPGGADVQNLELKEGGAVYERIARLGTSLWNTNSQNGLVVGATTPTELKRVREIAPDAPLLIPGVGAQGADAASVVWNAWGPNSPIIVNSSRAILYASSDESDFEEAAYNEAEKTREALQLATRDVSGEQ